MGHKWNGRAQRPAPTEMENRVAPLCPYYGTCGGCVYQHLPYEEELSLKEENLKQLLQKKLGLSEETFQPIVPSPEPYHYRSRLDLSLRRVRGKIQLGFMVEGTRQHIDIESCAIARPEISSFLPALKKLASERLPENYRSANLVVKTGDRGLVHWGGIGRRSLRMNEEDYFWTEVEGRRIFYSLDTFFQANPGVLPSLIQNLRTLLVPDSKTVLLDLYAGVGLFWAVFAPEVREVWAVEENGAASPVAETNRRYHGYSNVFLKEGKTEDFLEETLDPVSLSAERMAAIVDPPRKGLSPAALRGLVRTKALDPLVYVSCNPEALVRDLQVFLENGWRAEKIVPLDLFPRTRHLETLTRLTPRALIDLGKVSPV